MSVQNVDPTRGGLSNNGSPPSTFKSSTGPQGVGTNSLSVPADSEVSRAAGDERLAKEYAAQLTSGSRLRVPPESTLGRWLEALKSAFASPLLKRMLESGDFTAIDVDPVKGEVRLAYHGTLVRESVTLVDLPGGLDLFDSLVSAAKTLTPNGVLSLPAYFKDGTVGLSDVQRFYGEPAHLTPEQKVARSKELARHPVFLGQGSLPDNEVRMNVLRGIGNAHMWHSLLTVLKEQIERPAVSLDFDAITVNVAPYSDFWSEQQKQPATISLKQLLVDVGLKVPTTRDELVNLQNSLSAPPLLTAPQGDFGGLLSKEVPLNESNQKKLTEAVNNWKALQPQLPPDEQGRVPSLLEYLQRAVPANVRARAGKDPEEFLQVLISTPEARALGKQLQEAIDALATETSAQEALLAALGLEADPAAGMQRNNLAGYNLRQQDNWGRSSAEIVKRFEKHLEARFGPQLAPVAAFQLLAMSAPEFLVKDVPSSLVYGSQQWASFSSAVLRREQATPGASAGQSYAEIMQHDALEPITEHEQLQAQFAALQSVVDWGIANGVIEARSDDAYSAETIERAATALEAHVDGLVDATKALEATMPSRKDMALAELGRVYGVEMERFFQDKTLLGDLPPGSRKRGTYSLLDIYMSGDLYKHDWTSSSDAFPTAIVQAGFSKLPDIKAKFEEQFDAYVDALKRAMSTFFNYQLSQLPAEDRKMIEYGKVTTFSLGVPSSNVQGPVRPDHPMFKYVKSDGILIRAELNGKTRHYLYSPAHGQIIKDADPSRPGLRFPSSRLYFSMERPGRPGEQEDTVTILWQVLRTPWPRKDKIDFAAFSIYPSKSLDSQLPEPHSLPKTGVPSARINELGAVVGSYYSRGVEDAKAAARGETTQERDERQNKAAGEFLLSMIPFYDAIKSFIKGDVLAGLFYAVLDVIGLVVPALKGGSQAVKAGSKGLGAGLNFLKGFGKAGVRGLNPLSSVYDIGLGVFKLGKRGIKSLSRAKGVLSKKLRYGGGRRGGFDIPHHAKKEPIANGIYRPLGDSSNAVPTLAVQRNGKWYAYDPKTQVPYGAPLNGFTPGSGSNGVDAVFDSAVDFIPDAAFGNIPWRWPDGAQTHNNWRQGEVDRQSRPEAIRRLINQLVVARVQAFKLELQQANKDLAALTGLDAQGADSPAGGESTNIPVLMDQMEDALDALEERVIVEVDHFRVHFKRVIPAPIDSLSKTAVNDRLDAMEARLAEVKRALREMKVSPHRAA
ncbi:hypothetical protein [Pseudomonas sp. Marseille-Q1929]|uniref:hypothetical protein n=1 Tax=Pseudomonas sp. Marseille-Q1929 TaxID=2730402 RepID=UPI001A8E4F33|nr:hypothetical protein [Pseudomonas sp. Marseille-Q1929]MBO0494532.1 hypothetical protein [Pseudomonas sp. Marseille-Q1929]